MMSDNKVLEDFTRTARDFFNFVDSQMLFAVNLNMELIFCSDIFTTFTGITGGSKFSEQLIADVSQLEFNVSAVIGAIQLMFDDKIKRQICVPVSKGGVTRLINFYIGTILNPDTKQVVGAAVQMVRFNGYSRIEMVLHSHNEDYEPSIDEIDPVLNDDKTKFREVSNSDSLPIKLTKREENVVFLLILNYSSREIADILSKVENKKISKDAVDKLITNQLQVKFDVIYRYKLIERLVELGYHRITPSVFTDKFSKHSLFLD